MSWKGNKSGDARIRFYNNKACNDSLYIDEDYLDLNGTSGSGTFAMSKGTYYIMMYDWQEKPTSQLKFSVQKAVNKSNYCRAKAIALKSSQTVKIAQTADYSYSRWYKITVPKKKTVTITTNDGRADDIMLYDAKMREIECASGSKKVITEDKIAKGTYFIRVMSSRYSDDIGEYIGRYISIKWN